MCNKLKEITCPNCHEIYKLPVGKTADEFIKSLTTNFWIFQNAGEDKVNYERRSQLYKKFKTINETKREYKEILMSEIDDEVGTPITSILGTIVKVIVFTVPFFLMVGTYFMFVLFPFTNRFLQQYLIQKRVEKDTL